MEWSRKADRMNLGDFSYDHELYHTTGTKEFYVFDRYRFKEALKQYLKKEKLKAKEKHIIFKRDGVFEELYKETGVNVSLLQKFTITKQDSKERRHPIDINECKKLGLYLCDDEYVFLRQMKYEGLYEKIYRMLYDIFSLYDTSNCFNEIPRSVKVEEENYFSKLLDQVQKEIDCEIGRENEEIRNQLNDIVRASRIFVQSYSVPGVVESWLEINPNLRYYDPIFQIVESNPQLYEEITQGKYGGIQFRFKIAPEELLVEVKARRAYFEKLNDDNRKHNFQFTEERYFQDELLETLKRLFEQIEN